MINISFLNDNDGFLKGISSIVTDYLENQLAKKDSDGQFRQTCIFHEKIVH